MLPFQSHFSVYAGKFCFDYRNDTEAGQFEVRLTGNFQPGAVEDDIMVSDSAPCWGPCETTGNLYIMAFDDEELHWRKAHEEWDDLSCEQLLQYSSFASPVPEFTSAYNRTIKIYQKLRPRFWYFTFVACGVTVVDQLEYEIHAENMLQGWQHEFGMDQRGVVEMNVLAALLFGSLASCLRRIARRATGAEALRSRPLLRTLLGSTVCSAAGAVCLWLHYASYASNGWGLPTLQVIGQLLVCMAKALLTLLQLLTAKGWALFYSPGATAQRRLMTIAVAMIIVTSVACEIHADYFRDWSTAVYLYESWPGMIILGLNVALFVEAWRSMRETYRNETSDEVRVFYCVVTTASMLYFLTLPIMCCLAAVLQPWVRAKYVGRAEVASRFLATLLLSCCLRPSRLDAMVNARLEEGLETIGEAAEEELLTRDAYDDDEGEGSSRDRDDRHGGVSGDYCRDED